MSVHVDEAGAEDEAFPVDRFRRGVDRQVDPDRGDEAPQDSDVTDCRRPVAGVDGRFFDDQVEHWWSSGNGNTDSDLTSTGEWPCPELRPRATDRGAHPATRHASLSHSSVSCVARNFDPAASPATKLFSASHPPSTVSAIPFTYEARSLAR